MPIWLAISAIGAAPTSAVYCYYSFAVDMKFFFQQPWMRRHPSECEVPIGADELRIVVVHHAGKKLRRVWDRTLATLLLGTSGPCATRTRYRTLLRRAVMYLVIRHDTVPQVCTYLT